MRLLQIYLVRHAAAEPRGPAWPDDTLRPLTPRGARRFAEAAEGLAAMDGLPELILTSPLVRTRATATVLAEASEPAVKVVDLAPLAPGGRAAAVLAALRSRGRPTRVALVGHEPDLGKLAAYLIGASRPIPFKKGAMCRVDVPLTGRGGEGTLIWFLPPRALRRLAVSSHQRNTNVT